MSHRSKTWPCCLSGLPFPWFCRSWCWPMVPTRSFVTNKNGQRCLSIEDVPMPEISGDQLRGHLETMILSVLDRGDAHGLEILRRLEEAGCGALKLKEGSLYPALYRLENAGVIAAEWEEETKGRRGARRRIYHLTRSGAKGLAKGREEWQQFVQVVGGILAAPA